MDDSFFDIPGARNEQNDRAIPEFHMHSVPVGKNAEGVMQYEEREYVKIMTPGNAREIPDREVTEADKQRWQNSYAAFKANREAPIEGYPIVHWGLASEAEKRTLPSIGIRSVEDLANTPDINLQRHGGSLFNLKQKAIEWLREHQSKESLIAQLKAAETGRRGGSVPAGGEERTVVDTVTDESLRRENRELKEKNQDLRAEIADQRSKNKRYRTEIRNLKDRIKTLKGGQATTETDEIEDAAEAMEA